MPAAAQKPSLKFNANKKFKVVQFTDLHVKHQDPKSDIVFERVNQVIKDEKPDMIILTGDIIFSKPAKENLRNVLKTVASHNIPFSILFGNHDDEFDVSREELIKISDEFPNSLTADEPNLSGVGNYILQVQGSAGNKTEALLYCLDSHAYSTIPDVKGYGFINFDQINWYLNKSAGFTKGNNGKPLPALAFFHIALPEYAQAATSEDAQLYGIRREKSCPPALNTGMFTAMKQAGDVMGIFVGHDHNNDYAVSWHGILLAFGRYTGGDTVYNDLPNGARVIELTEGERGFRTWIRTAAGTTQETLFPSDYIKK
jgi:Predicted phosphoesterases, related to the Icc protein